MRDILGNSKAVRGGWRSGQAGRDGDALPALTCTVAWLGIPEHPQHLQEICRLGAEPGEQRIRRGMWEWEGGTQGRARAALYPKPPD